MLQRIRQYRRYLAGSFGTLLAAMWLSLALSPCVASATESTMEMPGMGHHAMAEADTVDCRHCSTAEAPCVTSDNACEEQPGVVRQDGDSFKLKPAALPAQEPQPGFSRDNRTASSDGSSVAPPHPPFTALYCRFKE